MSAAAKRNVNRDRAAKCADAAVDSNVNSTKVLRGTTQQVPVCMPMFARVRMPRRIAIRASQLKERQS